MIYAIYIDFIRAYHERYFIHRAVFCTDPFAETNGRGGGKRTGSANSNFQVSDPARETRRARIGSFGCADGLAWLLAMVHFMDCHDLSHHVRFCVFPCAGFQADFKKVRIA